MKIYKINEILCLVFIEIIYIYVNNCNKIKYNKQNMLIKSHIFMMEIILLFSHGMYALANH